MSQMGTPPPAFGMPSLRGGSLNEGGVEGSPSQYCGGRDLDVKRNLVDKQRCGRWLASCLVLVYTLLEGMAWQMLNFYAILYFQDVLRESNPTATRNMYIWLGTSSIASLFGGFIADAYWGRFFTICVFSMTYLVGFLIMTMSVSLPALRAPLCQGLICPRPSTSQVSIFYLALYVLGVSRAGVWPSICSFGADQFDGRDPIGRMSLNSFFNWFFFTNALGSFIAWTMLINIQPNEQWKFAIPTISITCAFCLFLLGIPLYRCRQLHENPFIRLAQVMVAAVRNRKVRLPLDEERLYEERAIHKHKSWDDKSFVPMLPASRKLCHTPSFQFLDKAAVVDTLKTMDGTTRLPLNRWHLCPISQVEEFKLILRVAPIWLGTFVFNVVHTQVPTLFALQGQQMGVAARTSNYLQGFTTLVVVITMPFYDLILIPMLQKLTGNVRGLSLLQRIEIGMVFMILSIVVATLVEMQGSRKILIFWFFPQYFLSGLVDVFSVVGQLEFFYDQVPDSMRSMGIAFSIMNYGVAQSLSSVLRTVVNHITMKISGERWIVEIDKSRSWHMEDEFVSRGHLNYYYWLLIIILSINLFLFAILAFRFKYKKVDTRSPSLASTSFEWNSSELGLMPEPTLFMQKSSFEVMEEEHTLENHE